MTNTGKMENWRSITKWMEMKDCSILSMTIHLSITKFSDMYCRFCLPMGLGCTGMCLWCMYVHMYWRIGLALVSHSYLAYLPR